MADHTKALAEPTAAKDHRMLAARACTEMWKHMPSVTVPQMMKAQAELERILYAATAQQAEPLILNGLTESETSATASVAGLVGEWRSPVAWVSRDALDWIASPERTPLASIMTNLYKTDQCAEGVPVYLAAPSSTVGDGQPRLTVRLQSFPESNGKRNWTALLVRTEKWGGLVGNCGGISLAHGELWNRVAYEAERAKLLIGERATEPDILDYGNDIETPDHWPGEVCGGRPVKRQPRPAAQAEPVAWGHFYDGALTAFREDEAGALKYADSMAMKYPHDKALRTVAALYTSPPPHHPAQGMALPELLEFVDAVEDAANEMAWAHGDHRAGCYQGGEEAERTCGISNLKRNVFHATLGALRAALAQAQKEQQ